MALNFKLEMRQGQALVMTPQLMQAIKLLQLSNLDLVAYVEEELERNPLLERAADDNDEPQVAAEDFDGDQTAFDDASFEAPDSAILTETLETRSAIEERLDTDFENVFPEDAAPGPAQDQSTTDWSNVGAGGREDGDYNPEAFVSAQLTLADHLAAQVTMAFTDPVKRLIAQYLADMVEETGYLAGDIAVVAEKLGAPLSEVEAVLKVLQTFDPPGICARNLNECLAIQLRERNRFDPAMEALVGRLDLLAKRDMGALRKLCGVDEEDLADMITEIRDLNPKPGLAFGSSAVQPAVPDVFVREAADGAFTVELNSDTLPKVLLNQTYHARIARDAKPAEKAYFAECLQTATWLIRALDQRARTILKVSIEIVKQQDAFFTHGVAHLRPLNLKTIADAISMHESTVSRVTSNKYMSTPRGVFELKYFFTAAISATDGGESHSAESVRHRIKQLIDDESPNGILSDDTLVEKLRASGIDIARRTVAKYREGMRIPSSVQRRREKAGSPVF